MAGGADATAIDRAADWLLSRQDADGTFDLEGGASAEVTGSGLLEHAVATVALLEAFSVRPRPMLRAGTDRALAHLVDRGRDMGGHLPYAGPARNSAATAWVLMAFMRADDLGWTGLGPAIDEGRRRLSFETGSLIGPTRLRPVDVSHVALVPRPASMVAPLGPVFEASEAVLISARR